MIYLLDQNSGEQTKTQTGEMVLKSAVRGEEEDGRTGSRIIYGGAEREDLCRLEPGGRPVPLFMK